MSNTKLPTLPGNVSHVMRRIRACESEVPAQIVLEHALHAYAEAAILVDRERQAGEAVAFEFYNPATGHAIVDYSQQTHVGPLTKEMGYEARPLGYVTPPPAAVKPGDLVPLWQAREALDSLEESARGDAPYNHFAASLVRTALEQAALASLPAPQAVQAGGVPAGWRFELVSDGDVRVYGPDCETWLLRAADKGTFEGFAHRMVLALAAAPSPDGKAEQAEAPSVLKEQLRKANQQFVDVSVALMKYVPESEAAAKSALQQLGDAHGYGWCQSALGKMWDVKHGCAPRGSMGVTVKDCATQPTASNAGERGDPAETADDSDRLKPCPFCGSEAEGCTMPAEQEDVGVGAMFVQCTNSRCMASSALIYPLMDDPKPLLLERWNRRAALATKPPAGEQKPVAHTYASTQATNCAGCGEHKHTPLRIDAMGGYVCLTCIDKKLGGLLGEFGYEDEAQPEQVAQDSAVLAFLDDLKDDAAAHIWPDDLERCQTRECTVTVASVRLGSPNGHTLPLFSRKQVADALRAARARGEGERS